MERSLLCLLLQQLSIDVHVEIKVLKGKVSKTKSRILQNNNGKENQIDLKLLQTCCVS